MQTLLPFANFEQTAMVLDTRRLGKQMVEAMQIYKILGPQPDGHVPAWSNHPAVRMWRGYREAIIIYVIALHNEWRMRHVAGERKGKQTHASGIAALHEWHWLPTGYTPPPPTWFGNEAFHSAHRSNLLRKGWEDGLWGAYRHHAEVLEGWLPQRKSDMTLELWETLAGFLNAAGIEHGNHYAQFGWAEDRHLPYVWPV